MPGGVVFLVCIPTYSYEHELIFGVPLKRNKRNEKGKFVIGPKVDLRLRETRTRTQLLTLDDDEELQSIADAENDSTGRRRGRGRRVSGQRDRNPVFVSMETVIRFKKQNLGCEKLSRAIASSRESLPL